MSLDLYALQQPLVSRPPYGQGRAQNPVGESGLPSAGPGGAPMYLHPGIPSAPRAPGEESEGMGDNEDWKWGENGSPKVVAVGGIPIEQYAQMSPEARERLWDSFERGPTQGLASGGPVAESGLPKGDPGGKGIKLDKDVPGESTYNKPEGDIRDFDRSKDPGKNSDPWRRESPDDQLKERDVVDDKEDWGLQHDGIGEMGKDWDPNDTKKTKYPYRDGLPHQHFAATEQNEFVAGLYLVELAHELRVRPGNRVLLATKPDEVITGLNPQFAQRAKSCGVTLKRVDASNLRWLFSVNCGNGAKVVKMKAFRAGNVVRLGKMDVDLSCSCPAWQWLGPEHHAKGNDYLDGSPRGTASTPVVRDPKGINRVCKHVAAVLSFAQGWEIPPKPKKK